MEIAVNRFAARVWKPEERAADCDWDWEAARVDGKLIRFGYQPDCVLVLVLTLARPKATDHQP
jgi:hypothetical protein